MVSLAVSASDLELCRLLQLRGERPAVIQAETGIPQNLQPFVILLERVGQNDVQSRRLTAPR